MAGKKGSKGNAGFKSGVWSVVFAIFVVGLLGAWIRINNIRTFEDAYNYFKSWSDRVGQCAPDDFSVKCEIERKANGTTDRNTTNSDKVGKPKGGNTTTTGTTGSGEKSGTSTSDKNGSTKGSTGVQKPQNTKDYLALLDKVSVAPAADVAYKRSDWKHWVGTPCDTRDMVLINQGKNVKVDKSNGRCKILSGTWFSPYEEATITEPKGIDIDHVIPLAYAARHGGQAWSAQKKQEFANDQSQLLAVSAKENRSKSDKGPEEYMPKARNYQCTYSKLWTETASKYGVSITEKDKFKLRDGLQKC